MATATTTMTGAQFDALSPEESRWWELFDGEVIEMPSPTPKHQLIIVDLTMSLEWFLRQNKLGFTLPAVDFALGPDWRLQPDIAVLLMDRSKIDINRTPVQGIPDIAIEVISPSERTAQSSRKVWAYLPGSLGPVRNQRSCYLCCRSTGSHRDWRRLAHNSPPPGLEYLSSADRQS